MSYRTLQFSGFWRAAGACQRHGVGGFVVQFTITEVTVFLFMALRSWLQLLVTAVAAARRLGSTLHRAPVGQGPPGPGWLAISFGLWSRRATGACYWHGVGGFVFNSPSSARRLGAYTAPRCLVSLLAERAHKKDKGKPEIANKQKTRGDPHRRSLARERAARCV